MQPTLMIENIAPKKAGGTPRLLLCIRDRMVYFGDAPPPFRLERFGWRWDAGGKPICPGRMVEDPDLTALLCNPFEERDAEERRFRECLRRCAALLAKGVTDVHLPTLNAEGRHRAARLFAHHPMRYHETLEPATVNETEEATFWWPAESDDRAAGVVIEGIPVYRNGLLSD